MDRDSLPRSLPGDMPTPSVALTVIGAIMLAHLRTLSPKKRKAFLTALFDVFEEYETTSHIVRLRGREYDAAVASSRRQAVAWSRGMFAAWWQATMLKEDADRDRHI